MNIKHRGYTIEVYDSITDLPAHRYFEYNRSAMIDAGIGSDLEAFDDRVANVLALIDTDPKGAKTELQNMRQAVRFCVSNTHPKMRSFVVLIKAINGKPFPDSKLNDKGIEETIQMLGRAGMTFKRIREMLQDVKKKFAFEFEQFFPRLSSDAVSKQSYAMLKKRTLFVLEQVTNGINRAKQISEIDKFFLGLIKPQVFWGHDGVEVQSIQAFERMCLLIQHHQLGNEPRNMTTLTFFNALETIRQKTKKK